MTAAILFSVAILALVALYGLHVWREVRMEQTNAARNMLRGPDPSQQQRIADIEERVTHIERVALPAAPPPLSSAEVLDFTKLGKRSDPPHEPEPPACA